MSHYQKPPELYDGLRLHQNENTGGCSPKVIEALAKLPTPFRLNGTVTAGNASGINDGACAMFVASEEAAGSFGLKPIARVVGAATAGVECRKGEGVLDETPGAYKAIDAVMAAQEDLVEIVHTLRQVLCVKG